MHKHSPRTATLFFLGLLLLVAGIGLLAAPLARANLFQDLWNGFLAPLGQNSSSSETAAPPAQNIQAPLYRPVEQYEQAVIVAVRRAAPAVVAITVSRNVPLLQDCAVDPFGDLPADIRRFFGSQLPQFQGRCPSGRSQLQEVGGGSGFIVSADGYVLTNKHVVADTSASYSVFTNDGKTYDARVLARDPMQDLAILKIDAVGLPTVVLGDSADLALGQTAIAIGNALGEFRNTVSVGVVSGLARTVTASGGGTSETISGLIQSDAAINPGNSGGPLLNLKGEVIGINTAMAAGAENIGFAIPINDAKRDVESVLLTGRIQTPYLGIRYVPIQPALQASRNLPVGYGALIESGQDGPGVVPNSPAAAAGLQAGDIILEINGTRLDSEHPLGTLIASHRVGEKLSLRILRNGETLSISITLKERPQG